MTDAQRNTIIQMRANGSGYSAIATAVGLTKDNVKSFCRAHNLGGVKAEAAPSFSPGKNCLYCGKPIKQAPNRKMKKFCSDKCRLSWWNKHPEMVKRKKIAELKCQCCGETFTSKNPMQKFCSWNCYAESRKAVQNG